MSRERELTMEIEVAGRSFNNQKEKLALTPPPSAKPIFHFRRHFKWRAYMLAIIDGTTPNSEHDLRYGFDWLGDEHYDFGKTDVLTERRGRYNYIHDNVQNSLNDQASNNTGKVTMVMRDKNMNSRESDTNAINGYKAVFQKDAKLSTIYGKDYFPSWINIRQSNEVKLKLGFRNANPNVGPQFGDNNDTVFLIVEPGYENNFIITPRKIKKSDLISGEIEIAITCQRAVEKDVSILVYHTDVNTAKTTNGSLDPVQDGIEVGELRVMKNNERFNLDYVLVKVQRSGESDFPSATLGPITDLAEAEKTLGRAFEQASIQCNFTLQNLLGCLDAEDSSFNNSNGSYDHEKYKNYINNKFLYEEYKVSLGGTTTVSFEDFESNKRRVRSRFSGTNKARFLLFIHDYANSKTDPGTSSHGVNGSADSVEEVHEADTGKWAVIYNNGHAGFDTAIHECAHTMGLQHTFNSYNCKEAPYFNPALGRAWNYAFIFPTPTPLNISSNPTTGNPTPVNITPTGITAIYYSQRNLHAKHLFRQGETENIMDYTWYYVYNSSLNKIFLSGPPPNGVYSTPQLQYGAETQNMYFQRTNTVINNYSRFSFFKWQWKILQKDDEVLKKELILTLPKLNTIDKMPPRPIKISVEPINIIKL